MRFFIDSATFLLTGAPYSRWSDEPGMEYISIFFALLALGMATYFLLAVTGVV